MNQGTKQRIVGTVVLLALALILLPILFDGEGSYQPEISSRIPDPPQIPLMPEPEPFRPAIAADTSGITIAADPEAGDGTGPDQAGDLGAAVVESQPAFARQVPELDAQGLPQGWVVRLGSFAEAGNAVNLVQRLQTAGYKAYSRRLRSDQGELTAVYVGPWVDRDRVDEYRRQLQEEFQLSGMVVRFELEQL